MLERRELAVLGQSTSHAVAHNMKSISKYGYPLFVHDCPTCFESSHGDSTHFFFMSNHPVGDNWTLKSPATQFREVPLSYTPNTISFAVITSLIVTTDSSPRLARLSIMLLMACCSTALMFAGLSPSSN